METCPHVNDLDVGGKCRSSKPSRPSSSHYDPLQQLLDPYSWTCEDCGTTDSVWSCLSCPSMRCGWNNQQHAHEHYLESRHPLAIEVNKKYVHCYDCKQWVMNDNVNGDIARMRELVTQTHCQTQKNQYAESKTRSGRVIRHRTTQGSMKRRAKDSDLIQQGRLFDVLFRWRYLLVAKAFNSWCDFVSRAKVLNTKKEDRPSIDSIDTGLALSAMSSTSSLTPESGTTTPTPTVQVDAGVDVKPTTPPPLVGTERASLTRLPRRTHSKRASAMVPGQTGLRNLGNTCFMNAVLQALSHTAIFKHYFVAMDLQAKHASAGIMTPLETTLKSTAMRRRDTAWCFEHVTTRKSTGRAAAREGGLKGGAGKKGSSSNTSNTNSDMSLSYEVHALMRVMWSGRWNCVTPHALLHAIWRLIPSFRGYMQQDAQEFMCKLLDGLQDELDVFTNIPAGGLLPPEGVDKRTKLHRGNIVNAAFGGSLLSTVRCSRCKNVSKTSDLFLDLSLDFPSGIKANHARTTRRLSRNNSGSSVCEGTSDSGNKNNPLEACSITDMLDVFTKTETLDGDVYMCSICNDNKHKRPVLTHATKALSINSLPYILRLHMKRFRWQGRTREKVCNLVDFPINGLDMRDYCDTVLEGCENSYMYDLYAVVNHHGQGFNSGHYTSYCFNSDTGLWTLFNDARMVRNISEEDIISPSAYILMYARRDLPSIQANAPMSTRLDEDLQSMKELNNVSKRARILHPM
eukprot:CFRG6769T1